MTEVRRPAPPQPPRERWRQAISARRAAASPFAALRRSRVSHSNDGAAVGGGAVVGLLLGVGALLLIVAGAFALSSWRGRSSVPIDDQLPYLLGVDDSVTSESGASAASDRSAEPPATVDASEQPIATVEADELPGAPGPTGSETNDAAEIAASSARVVVHVSGAVATPGVVELGNGARVHHAVGAAGGATPRADLERVNLAAVLVDGERIHVPQIGDGEPPTIVAPSRVAESSLGAAASGAEAEVRVDINRASVAELEELPGIGPSIARAILDLRTARGAYASVDELLLVDGIGPNKLETLRPHAFVTG